MLRTKDEWSDRQEEIYAGLKQIGVSPEELLGLARTEQLLDEINSRVTKEDTLRVDYYEIQGCDVTGIYCSWGDKEASNFDVEEHHKYDTAWRNQQVIMSCTEKWFNQFCKLNNLSYRYEKNS